MTEYAKAAGNPPHPGPGPDHSGQGQTHGEQPYQSTAGGQGYSGPQAFWNGDPRQWSGYQPPPPYPYPPPGYYPPPPGYGYAEPPPNHGGNAGQAAGAGYGQGARVSDLVNEVAGGGSGLSSLTRMLDLDDIDFWKGALVGAAAVLLLTNSSVQSALFGAGAKTDKTDADS